MKSIIVLLVAVVLTGNVASAQKTVIPSGVKSAFLKKYPSATNVKWDKEQTKYEASFKLEGNEMSVLYNGNGTPEEIETKIPISEVPASAQKVAKSKGVIKGAARILDVASGKVKYEVEVAGKDVFFTEKWEFIEEKVEKD